MNKYNKNNLKIIIKFNTLQFRVFDEEFVKNNNDKCKIIIIGREDFEFKQLGVEIKDENLNNFLLKYNHEKLEIILKETKTITNMDNMFKFSQCEIKSIDFKNWDTTNVTSMKNMFFTCGNIKGISTWNTSNVRDMSHMF